MITLIYIYSLQFNVILTLEYTLAKSMSDMMQMQKVLSEFAELVQRFNQSAEGYILYGQVIIFFKNFNFDPIYPCT